jgi:alpha-galactosidase
LGAVRVGPKMEHHWTNFTPDEQKTLMTLWCVSRSPLIFGGYLPWNDSFTESLITNDEVLAVDKFSEQNRQLFRKNGLIAWTARVSNSHDRYLALFNTEDTSNVISVPLTLVGFEGYVKVRDLWTQNDLGRFDRIFSQAIPAHGAALFRVGSSGL